VAFFKEKYFTSIQSEVDDTYIVEPCKTANEFAKHFQSVHNKPRTDVLPTLSSSSELLSLSHSYDSDYFKALMLLRPSKSTGVDDIPGFVIKDCSVIFVPVHKHICNSGYPVSIFLL
jgi:hypothetical protein